MLNKKIILSLISCFIIVSKCYLQDFDYGFVIESSKSSHTNTDPTKPEDGQFQWKDLTTFGAGFYASKQIFNIVNFSSSLIFRQRGYTEEAQTGPIGTPIKSYPSLQNRLNYISIEARVKFQRNSLKKIKISPITGLSLNTLVSRKIESEGIDEINDVYPVILYKDNWKRFNINYLIGISIYQLNRYSLDFTFNRSITPLLSLENLVVKDWVWSGNLSISLQQLLKKE